MDGCQKGGKDYSKRIVMPKKRKNLVSTNGVGGAKARWPSAGNGLGKMSKIK